MPLILFSSRKKVAAVVTDLDLNFDIYWNQTVLSIHGGQNDTYDKTFRDSSGSNVAVTTYGAARQGFNSPFASTESGSILVAKGNDYISVPYSANLSLQGDFTVETWFKLDSVANWWQYICGKGATGVNHDFSIVFTNATTLACYSNAAATNLTVTVPALQAGVWYHVAFVRSGSTNTFYLNGVSYGSNTMTISNTNVTNPFMIGRQSYNSSAAAMTGLISNFRITKSAVYSGSSFSVPTAPLTSITNCVLLLNAVSTGVGSNNHTFIDSSTNNLAVTRYGNVTQGSFSPFPNAGGSAYFDGAGDYLETSALSSHANLGTGDFTVECWVNIVGDSAADPNNTKSAIIMSSSDGTGDFNILGNSTSSGKMLELYSGSGKSLIFNYNFTKGIWYHVAYVRRSGTLHVYVNGTSIGSGSFNHQVGADGSTLRFGGRPGAIWNRYLNGFLSNIRIVKGSAVYTSNFDVPTAPLSVVSNTTLLLKFENAGIVDATNNNVLETVGDVIVSTSQKKFGNTSLNFNGSSCVILPARADFNFGAQDFTIECWFNLTADSAAENGGNRVASLFVISSSTTEFGLVTLIGNTTTTGTGIGLWNGSTGAGFSYTFSKNTWYHLAVVKSNGQTTVFINGIRIGTSNTLTTFGSTNNLYIGRGIITGHSRFFNGYMDDIRISKYARYQTNFTPRSDKFYDVAPTDFDPYWDKVVLRMTMDGSDNGNTFTDLTGKSVVRNGNTVTKTSYKKFGTASTYFNGVDSSLAISGSYTDLNFGTGDFTIEMWVLPTTSSQGYLLDFRPLSTNGLYPTMKIEGTPRVFDFWTNSATARAISKTPVVANNWYHVAYVRNSGVTSIFVNGIKEASITDTTNYICGANRPVFGVDGFYGNATYFGGYIDDLRITKGLARYTNNFEVPSKALPVNDFVVPSTEPKYDPYLNETVLLMPLSNSFTDVKGNTITASGTLSIDGTKAKFGTSSVNFNVGTLTTQSSDWSLSGNFTVEAWVYITNYTYGTICANNAGSFPYMFMVNSAGGISLYQSSSAGSRVIAYDTKVIDLNTWYHIAFVRAQGVVTVYINGTKLVSANYTQVLGGVGTLTVGNDVYNDTLRGNMQDLRITKGKARYTTNFNVPTEPFPIIGASF